MINRIVLRSIRSYSNDAAVFDFPVGLSVLYGKNGIGKTTVLESIHLLTTLKSFRTNSLATLIAHGSEEASAEAKFSTPDHIRKIDIFPRSKKISRDHQKQMQVEPFLDGEKAVCLAPEHQGIVRESPQERRSYLDTLLFGRDPTFLTLSRRYNRALKQKAALLRQELPKIDYHQLVTPWNEELIRTNEIIREKRIQLVAGLKPTVQALYETISQSSDRADLDYRFSEKTLVQELAQKTDAEYFAKRVLTGCHRDDMNILLRNKSAKETASQGEVSSLLLALKIAEMESLQSIHTKAPILLLDDVGGTLDENRKNKLFAWLTTRENQQTILTTADAHLFDMVRDLGAVPVRRLEN